MAALEYPRDSGERLGSLDSVPDWRYHPCSLISPLGAQLSRIEVVETNEEIPVPPAVQAIKTRLEPHTKPGSFYDGRFQSVTDIGIGPLGTVHVETKRTSNFAFAAAAYVFRNNETENPVRPFAVQATVFSRNRKKILLEKRLHSLDYRGTRTTIGGALLPEETNIERVLIDRIAAKSKHGDELYVPDLTEDQITPIGIVRDNILNAYCAAYMITLTDEQYGRALGFAEEDSEKREDNTRNRYYFELDVDAIDEKLDSLWRWEPSTFANILYALVASGNRTPEEAREILKRAEMKLRNQPMAYTYPAERILGLEKKGEISGFTTQST